MKREHECRVDKNGRCDSCPCHRNGPQPFVIETPGQAIKLIASLKKNIPKNARPAYVILPLTRKQLKKIRKIKILRN